MEVIDEEGRFFGYVNVVDGLVVLLGLAVVVAGVGLIVGGTQSDDDGLIRYATVSYSTPVDTQAALLKPGDDLSLGGNSESYEVVDVHRSFEPDGDAHIAARLAYREEFTDGENRLLAGDSISATTNSSRVQTQVGVFNQSTATIPTHDVSVVMALNSSSAVRNALKAGDRATIGDRTVATVESVRRFNGSDSRLTAVAIELTARDRRTGSSFGDTTIRVGSHATIVTDRAVVRGTVHRVGPTSEVDTPETDV